MARTTDFVNAVSDVTGQACNRASDARVALCTNYFSYEAGSRGGTFDMIQALRSGEPAETGVDERLSDMWLFHGVAQGQAGGSKRWKEIRDKMIIEHNL